MKAKQVNKKSMILVLNPGSSSLKWAGFSCVFDAEPDCSGAVLYEELEVFLNKFKKSFSTSIGVVRFVHGGGEFSAPTIVTDQILNKLQRQNDLAPLHNPKSVQCLQKLKKVLQPSLGCIAVFDSEFFNQLPIESQTYGIPGKLSKKYSIRRYGFHGFAHQSMFNFWRTLQHAKKKKSTTTSRLITIQLGSGCSMAAIKDGKPIDTTMGFTPNEGLLMATRCGDIDPGIITWLQRKENLNSVEVDTILNFQSGLLGISGESANMEILLNSQSKQSKLAIDVFCWRIRKSIGAYFALLGGLDGVILSGGIAENAITLCQRVLAKLEHLGIDLSSKAAPVEPDPVESAIRLNSHQSKVTCWIVRNDEPQSILRSLQQNTQTKKLLEGENYVSNS